MRAVAPGMAVLGYGQMALLGYGQQIWAAVLLRTVCSR